MWPFLNNIILLFLIAVTLELRQSKEIIYCRFHNVWLTVSVCKYAGIVQFVYSFYVFSFSFSKTSRLIIIDKLGLRRFTRMLGTAHREEDENGTVEIADSYNNILKLFLRGRI